MDCRDDEQARFNVTKDEGTRQPELSFESIDIKDTVKSTFGKNVRTRLNKCMQRIGGKAKYIHAQSPYMDCRDDEQARFNETKDEGTRQPELSFESIDIEDTVKSTFGKNVRTRLNKCMQRIGGKAKYIHAQSPYMDCRDDEQQARKDEGTRQPELSFKSIDIEDTIKSTFRKNVRTRLNNCMQRIGGKAKYIHAQSPYMDCRDDEQARFNERKDEEPDSLNFLLNQSTLRILSRAPSVKMSGLVSIIAC
jgi:tRNA A37 threonylcarbamoyladenosine dehydratase